MRLIKIILLGLLALIVLACGGSYFYLQSTKPQLEGTLSLEGLHEAVEVYFDEYGIPHIYAQNEEDAQFALGYVHAQDRLFQMEMIRRVSNGQLAEILGPDLAKTDRFFRTIGVKTSAKKSTAIFNQLDDNDPMKKAALAYYKGINAFMDEGATPLEFQILGIPKRHFTIEDTYAIYGYMGFSFAQAFRTDPLITRISQKLGSEYLQDLDVHWNPIAQTIPVSGRASADSLLSNHFNIDQLFESLPVAPWIGSNAWVIGPSKTKSGKVIFSNDTHMQFSQPSVWYEAHLVYPGHNLYGSYLAGVPFMVLGHNDHMAVGLTMFENDDIDFYIEQLNPDNPNEVKFKDTWEALNVREETVKVKGGDDLVFEVKTSRHGPIVNDAIDHVANTSEAPVSMWWLFNEFPSTSLEASYRMSRAKDLESVRAGVALGVAPGLNVMYGDKEGNIAWWTMAKLPRRPDHVNSKLFLDGASGEDEILGYFDFSENPQSENPASGYVYSANNQPDTTAGFLHQGYYIPEDRAKRIVNVLNKDKKWDLEMAKNFINDVQSPIMPELAKTFAEQVQLDDLSDNEAKAIEILQAWNGDNQLDMTAPTIYTKLIYHTLAKTFGDELGEDDFNTFLSTHLFKRSYPFLFKKENSPWWDDVSTSDLQEKRSDIISAAFRQTINELETQLGADIAQWQWENVHLIEHPHALGQVPSLAKMFNVGPFPINGNNETVNNQMFRPNSDGTYIVKAGPAKRRIIDFSDLEHSINVLPTGQSGNVMSPHYADQAQMFVNGEFRLQKMNKDEITGAGSKKLILQPK